MRDCPNCGKPVEDGVRLCPSCGFDTQEEQADEVRRLREEGQIEPGSHPGRGDWSGGDPERFREGEPSELPAEDRGALRPSDLDAGL